MEKHRVKQGCEAISLIRLTKFFQPTITVRLRKSMVFNLRSLKSQCAARLRQFLCAYKVSFKIDCFAERSGQAVVPPRNDNVRWFIFLNLIQDLIYIGAEPKHRVKRGREAISSIRLTKFSTTLPH